MPYFTAPFSSSKAANNTTAFSSSYIINKNNISCKIFAQAYLQNFDIRANLIGKANFPTEVFALLSRQFNSPQCVQAFRHTLYLIWLKLQEFCNRLWNLSNPSVVNSENISLVMLSKNLLARDCIWPTITLPFSAVWASWSSCRIITARAAKRIWKCDISAVGSELMLQAKARK